MFEHVGATVYHAFLRSEGVAVSRGWSGWVEGGSRVVRWPERYSRAERRDDDLETPRVSTTCGAASMVRHVRVTLSGGGGRC